MNLTSYLEQHPKKFLVFDLDETILRLQLPWEKYLDPVKDRLRSFDPQILEDRLEKKISLAEMQNAYVRKGEESKSYIKKYNEVFESQLQHYDPNPNLIEFVKNDTNHVLYLWSSNCRTTVEKVLKTEGILHHFATLVTDSDVSFIKPDIEGFSHIYLQGNNLQDYLFIGDNKKTDGIASEKVGIDFFEVNYFKLIA